MPNPFATTSQQDSKPVLTPQESNDVLGAIAIKKQTPGPIARLRQRHAISVAQTAVMMRRVEAVRDVQNAEVDVVRLEAIAAATTAARLRGINLRAAIVAECATSLGSLQTSLVVEKAAVSSELGGARFAGAHANLQAHNERRDEVLAQHKAGQLTDDQACKMIALIEGLHAQAEEAVDESYEGGRKVLSSAFELATVTASEVKKSLVEHN